MNKIQKQEFKTLKTELVTLEKGIAIHPTNGWLYHQATTLCNKLLTYFSLACDHEGYSNNQSKFDKYKGLLEQHRHWITEDFGNGKKRFILKFDE
jgi:hypothetical protein